MTAVADRRPVGFGHPAPGASGERGSADVVQGTQLLDDEAVARLVPERDKRGHKGSFGKLLVLAGSLDYAGAALLVCRAAGRAGAGLVTLAVPESLQPLFAAKVVEATTMALPEDDVEEVDPEPALAKLLDHEHDALVIGPGLRPSLAIAELLRLVLTAPEEGAAAWPAEAPPRPRRRRPSCSMRRRCGPSPRPMAGGRASGARACSPRTPASSRGSGRGAATSRATTVIWGATIEARATAAAAAAVEWRQVVVLKGARTVIAAPDGSVAVAPFENAAMASGGTGDVLAGTIGALLAQGLAPYDAARLGVYLHGLAGEAVSERIGDAGLLAGDLPDALPIGRRRLARIAERQRSGRRLGFGARDEAADPADGAAAATAGDGSGDGVAG